MPQRRRAAGRRRVRAQERGSRARNGMRRPGPVGYADVMPRAAAIPDATWRAIETRDRRVDGRFVYGVTSTHIFCRPSCPSRRPRRDRVRLFRDPADAEAAGFRACRRCHPAGAAAPSATVRAVERARRLIDAHVDADRDGRLTLAALSAACGISPFHLQRAFRRMVGASPKTYADERRAARLRARLKEGVPVTTATYDVGYGSSRAVYEQAGRHLGMTPGAYRRGGAGERIRAVVTPTPFGQLLVAATDRGVCRVMLGDDARALEADLAAEFPRAELAGADAGLRAHVAAIRRQLASGAEDGPPVDVGGTAFEQQVWRALRAIPYGEVRSYQQVAQAIGRPTAARAVAQACAANPVALVVPCHRVVRADGASGGYRWGAERKAAILEHERRGGEAGATRRPARRTPRLRVVDWAGAPRQRAPCLEPLMSILDPRPVHRRPAADRRPGSGAAGPAPRSRRKEDPGRLGRDRDHRLPQGAGVHRHPAARGLHAPRPERHRPQLPPERTAKAHRHRQDARRRPGRDRRAGAQERPAGHRAGRARRQHACRDRRAPLRRSDAVVAGAGPGRHRGDGLHARYACSTTAARSSCGSSAS